MSPSPLMLCLPRRSGRQIAKERSSRGIGSSRKTIFGLTDLNQAKTAVLNLLSCSHGFNMVQQLPFADKVSPSPDKLLNGYSSPLKYVEGCSVS